MRSRLNDMVADRARCIVPAFIASLWGLAVVGGATSPLNAADIGPPMFDVAKICDSGTHGNTTAMSECVVAESETRAELLQNWSKYPDATAVKCVKLGRQAKRNPYAVVAKCITDTAATPSAAPAKKAAAAPPRAADPAASRAAATAPARK